MQTKASRQAFKVALIYVIVAGAWILFSDELLKRLVHDPDTRTLISIYKGWAFVLVTGGLLYLVLRRLLNRWVKAMEKSRRSEEQLQLVAQATADGLWDWNLQTGLAELSPRYWEIIGYAPGEAVPDKEFFKRLVHPEDWPGVEAAMSDHFARKTSQSLIEYRMLTKDGAEKWIWGRGKVVAQAADGTPLRMVGTISDITFQKQSELLLVKSEERYRSLFENMNEGFALCRMIFANGQPTDFVYLATNQTFTTLTGLKDVVGKRVTEIIPGVRARDPDLFELYARVVRTRRPEKQERFLASLQMWFSLAVYSTEPDTFVVVFDTITERKRAETALRTSESRLQFLLSATPAIIYSLSGTEQNATTFVSANVQAVLGHKPEAFSNDQGFWAAHVHPDDLPAAATNFAKFTGGDAITREYRFRHGDGRYRWMRDETSVIRGAPGQPQEFVGHWFDITERKQAEAAQQYERSQLRTLIDHLPDMVYVRDTAGRFLIANQGFARRMGTTTEGLLGKTDADFYSAEVAASFAANDRKVLAGGEILDHECTVNFPNGEALRVVSTKVPLKSDSGEVIGLVGVIHDLTERKRVEQDIQRLAAFARYNPNPVLELSATGEIIYFNAAASQMAEALGQQHPAGMLPRNVAAIVHDCLTQAKPLLRQETQAGTRTISWSFFPVELNQSVHCYAGDITERKQAERELLESQALYASLVLQLPIGIFRKDEQGRFVLVNPGFCQLKGMVEADFLGKTPLEVIHTEAAKRDTTARGTKYAAEGEDHHRQIMRTGRSIELDEEYTLPNGEKQFVHVMKFPVLSVDGKIIGTQGVQFDITERKRAEERAHLQFSALFAAANAIVITDRQGKIEWVNPSFTKLTGYTAAEAIGANPRVLKSDQHPPAFYATLWATISTGNAWHGEMINKRKDGRLYTEDMTITPVRSGDGQIRHFVAIKQDVSERRQLENRLQQAQKMEAIGTLAGGIAHDFNNILAAIFGYGNLLQQDTEGNSAAQEDIGEILKAAGRAKELVQQILTFSRQREQKRQVIRLDLVVKEATKFLRASLPAQIKIEMNLAADAPAVLADPTQIYQVTMNLATNALHAMEGRPGKLTVALDPFLPDENFIQSHSEFRPIQYARLTVADTGLGMDAKTLARIFEPFFTTKPVGKGTGLGLAVVHGIVQSHDGAITVESQPGQGTTFCLYFPAQTPTDAVSEATAAKLPGGHGQKILLVDDEPALTDTFQRLLTRMNYQAASCNSAREALARFREHPTQIDLVITDLTMPEMNGLELARQLHALHPELPVMLASGFTADLSREDLHAAGIRELLEKPIALPALADALQRVFAPSESAGRPA